MAIRNIGHRVEKSVGKAKVVLGRATGNKRLATKGRAQKAKADLRLASDRVRHVAKDARDALNDWSRRFLKGVWAGRGRVAARDRRHA
jgi:uncharacterized protein YjbJ (UPF0337 family)